MSPRSGFILNFPCFLCFPGTCDNGGTWEQGQCACRPGFSGDRCQFQTSCLNGGQWDNLKCQCPSTFYGSRCEFAVEQVDLGESPELCLLHFLPEGVTDSPQTYPSVGPGGTHGVLLSPSLPAISPIPSTAPCHAPLHPHP